MENDMAISKIKLKIDTVYQKEPNGIYYFRYQGYNYNPFPGSEQMHIPVIYTFRQMIFQPTG